MATKTLQSLERGLDLLFLFSADQPTLSLTEIASALKLPTSTAYRIVATCCKKNVLARDPHARRYELHGSIVRLQQALSARLDIRRIALPHLTELAAASGETSQLFLLQGNEVVCAHAISSPNTVRVMPELGRAVPLHAGALGRVVLAFLPEPFLQKYIERTGLPPLTAHTIVDAQKLRAVLVQIRKQGYAVTFQQTYMGARGIAVPIFDARGGPIGSLGISGPHPRFSDTKARSVALPLIARARAIADALNHGQHGSEKTDHSRNEEIGICPP